MHYLAIQWLHKKKSQRIERERNGNSRFMEIAFKIRCIIFIICCSRSSPATSMTTTATTMVTTANGMDGGLCLPLRDNHICNGKHKHTAATFNRCSVLPIKLCPHDACIFIVCLHGMQSTAREKMQQKKKKHIDWGSYLVIVAIYK